MGDRQPKKGATKEFLRLRERQIAKIREFRCVRLVWNRDLRRDVASLLEGLILPDFILEELCNDVRAQYTEERAVDAARMSALEGQLRRAKSRRERLYDDYADEALSREEHDERKRALVAEIREIEAAMASLSGQESRSYDEAVEILELAKTAHLMFKSAGPDENRQIVSAMLSNCKFDGERVVADLNMLFDLMLNVAREGVWADPENEKSVVWWRQGGSNP